MLEVSYRYHQKALVEANVAIRLSFPNHLSLVNCMLFDILFDVLFDVEVRCPHQPNLLNINAIASKVPPFEGRKSDDSIHLLFININPCPSTSLDSNGHSLSGFALHWRARESHDQIKTIGYPMIIPSTATANTCMNSQSRTKSINTLCAIHFMEYGALL